jgi:propanol-preferring alcohol dehydrogenase
MTMRAWVLKKVCDLQTEKKPLIMIGLSLPEPGDHEVRIRTLCCGVCHTELDEIEGRTPPASFPMTLGHQVVGLIDKNGPGSHRFEVGDRVGVAWIYSACGECEDCLAGRENLCPHFKGTGRDANGGYAEYMTVNEKFAYLIPKIFTDAQAAPLLCAGAIGFRSLNLTGLINGQTLGLSGFGASGHLVLKMATFLFPDSKIQVFARSETEQEFARSLGAYWAGDFNETPPIKSHAIIDTTPVWHTIMQSLLNLHAGGRLIINAIRKENVDKESLLAINYSEHLWLEKEIKSVANIVREDVERFLELAASIPIISEVEIYPFDKANEAIHDIKHKHVKGAKVLVMP